MNTSPFPETKEEIEAKKVLGAIHKQYGKEENEAAILEVIEPYIVGPAKSLAPYVAKLIWQRVSMVQLFAWETERKITAGLVNDALKQIEGMVENHLLVKVK